MQDKVNLSEQAIIVHLDLVDRQSQEDLEEFRTLVVSAGVEPLVVVRSARNTLDPKTFLGRGKVEEIKDIISQYQPTVVLVNHILSPSQERNLERMWQCPVLDRTGVILDIFAQRARTFEGKLQVELAQLQHLSTRLVRGWTHLERQKGGIGLRGPGETQLETDRRLLRARVKMINKRLGKVKQQRTLGRRARQRADMPTVSTVGYTNAGKSTLFNVLTGETTYVADKLFATLDPLMRRLSLPGSHDAIIADTVGFIRHLPHDLVEAFSATLEETRDASLLLHVIDVSDLNWRDNVEQVELVLKSIDSDKVPTLKVFNKIDVLGEDVLPMEKGLDGKPLSVWVSAKEGIGIDTLREAIEIHLFGDPVYRTLTLAPEQGKVRAKLYALDAVLNEEMDDEGQSILRIRLSEKDFESILKSLV